MSRLDHILGIGSVAGIGTTDHRHVGVAGLQNRLRHTGGVDGSRVDGLDTAGREQIGGERSTNVVLGEWAERQQQNLRARPGPLELGIRSVPQRFKPGRVTLDSCFQVVRG